MGLHGNCWKQNTPNQVSIGRSTETQNENQSKKKENDKGRNVMRPRNENYFFLARSVPRCDDDANRTIIHCMKRYANEYMDL